MAHDVMMTRHGRSGSTAAMVLPADHPAVVGARQERLRGRLASIKRQGRAAASEGDGYSSADVRAHLKHQNGQCWWCSAAVGDDYHIDHRFPLAKGGRHDSSNIVISCPACNLRKNTKMPWEFAGRLL